MKTFCKVLIIGWVVSRSFALTVSVIDDAYKKFKDVGIIGTALIICMLFVGLQFAVLYGAGVLTFED